MANIEMFKANLTGGGARANQFEVHMNFPAIAAAGEAGRKMQYLCRTASLPASTVEPIEVPYRGRKLYLAGERTYEDWTTTIYNDTDFLIHDAVERWIDGMDRTLVEATNVTNPMLYQSTAQVHQLDRNGSKLKSYDFVGMFPTTLAAIELGYDTDNEVETFDVTWKFNYFMSITSPHITTI
tara:strand:- start:1673 stop:2218 length:546 start_codon:yes stop_codon:yes gene_type:complete